MSGPRYAIYWSPAASHPLWDGGCRWLGSDAATGACMPAAPHTEAPRRYGFHATLKPPLRLRPGCNEASLLDAAAALARGLPSFEMPRLDVGWLAGFLALRPVQPLPAQHPLRLLANACVAKLDAWRAEPSTAELERRAVGLDRWQKLLLQRWGYPHVFEGWRFHMTLSDTLAAADAALEAAARAHFAAALAVPLRCEDVSVFIEDAPGQPFRLLRRLPLGPA